MTNTSETKRPLVAFLIILSVQKSCTLHIYFVYDVKVEKIIQVYKDEGHIWEGSTEDKTILNNVTLNFHHTPKEQQKTKKKGKTPQRK